MKIKKGDTVVVIAGKDKGREGEVAQVFPKDNKVIVSGVNTATKHQKQRRQNTPGGRIDRDMPIDASNVMLVYKGKPTRVGFKTNKDGEKVRFAKRTGDIIG